MLEAGCGGSRAACGGGREVVKQCSIYTPCIAVSPDAHLLDQIFLALAQLVLPPQPNCSQTWNSNLEEKPFFGASPAKPLYLF